SQAQEQAFFRVKDSRESAMPVNEGAVSRFGATNKVRLYFIIATLVALLVFALATVMVLVVQRTVRVVGISFSQERLCWKSPRVDSGYWSSAAPVNTCLLPFPVSRQVNSSKLSLVEKGICDDIQCKSEELVIKEQGVYLIFCHLNFHFPNWSNRPTDLKIQLLVNDRPTKQMLSTWCASESCQGKTFKTLFELHLTYLNVKDRVSVALNYPEFLNEVSLPNDNVLGVLRYSDEM
ncbi:TNFL8 factor, partial [Formicarius rufipectus]|nr:TNFL8 factor [Formicarius rufipectus]